MEIPQNVAEAIKNKSTTSGHPAEYAAPFTPARGLDPFNPDPVEEGVKAKFAVSVSHSRTHFSVYVEEEFASFFTTRYRAFIGRQTVSGPTNFFTLTPVKSRGVKIGKTVEYLDGRKDRRLQFRSFSEITDPPGHFGRTKAILRMYEDLSCDIELIADLGTPRKSWKRKPSPRKPATPDENPIPLAPIPPQQAIDPERVRRVHDFLMAQAGAVVSRDEFITALGTVNRWLSENPEAEAHVSHRDEAGDKITVSRTEIFE